MGGVRVRNFERRNKTDGRCQRHQWRLIDRFKHLVDFFLFKKAKRERHNFDRRAANLRNLISWSLLFSIPWKTATDQELIPSLWVANCQRKENRGSCRHLQSITYRVITLGSRVERAKADDKYFESPSKVETASTLPRPWRVSVSRELATVSATGPSMLYFCNIRSSSPFVRPGPISYFSAKNSCKIADVFVLQK